MSATRGQHTHLPLLGGVQSWKEIGDTPVDKINRGVYANRTYQDKYGNNSDIIPGIMEVMIAGTPSLQCRNMTSEDRVAHVSEWTDKPWHDYCRERPNMGVGAFGWLSDWAAQRFDVQSSTWWGCD